MMSNWHTVPLGKVVTFQRGYDLPNRDRKEGSIPIVSSAGVTDYHNAPMVDPPGVVTGRYGTIGEVFFITEAFWPLNTTLYVRDFHGNDPSFVYYLLQRFDFRSFSGKSGVPGVNRNDLHAESITLPLDIAEQRAIATALSDMDALLDALDRLIAKKRDLKQAAMQQLLTGQTRLPGFTGEWEQVSMREVLTQNATYGIVTAGTFVQNGVKMLRGGDIVDGRVNTDLPMVSCNKSAEYSRTVLVKDDVVIALVGYPGASAKIPEVLIGANISRAVGLLRPNSKVFPEFLVYFLNSSDGRRMVLAPSAGSAQQVVNLAALNKLQFTIPPLPEQTAIATVLADMDAEIVALEKRRDKTRALKQAMMQELLTGKTRLIPKEKPLG